MREYSKLSCGCMCSCDEGGGLLGKCNSSNCQFGVWSTKHDLCDVCNKCLSCANHEGHSQIDGLEYLKNILGM